MATKEQIIKLASDAAFGNPLVTNNLRSIVVEAIVSTALDKNWRWCSADWAPYDFIHADGTRLEVKQSAAIQTWSKANIRRSRPVFDIAPRKGYYEEGVKWIPGSQRFADVYVFAYHPDVTRPNVDHREPEQWVFYAARVETLPATKTISLGRIQALATPVGVTGLDSEVNSLRNCQVS